MALCKITGCFGNKHLLWNWVSWECFQMKIIKGKLIFIMLFLTSFDSNMADICMARFVVWALSSDYCMVCFFGKAFLKSDTAVALRRSVSIIPCIIVVYFINVYYEYFRKLMWLSAKSPDVLELQNITRQCKLRFFVLELQNITRQCKLRCLYINMNFIKQNIHVLCNMKSYECHLMKIIKG